MAYTALQAARFVPQTTKDLLKELHSLNLRDDHSVLTTATELLAAIDEAVKQGKDTQALMLQWKAIDQELEERKRIFTELDAAHRKLQEELASCNFSLPKKVSDPEIKDGLLDMAAIQRNDFIADLNSNLRRMQTGFQNFFNDLKESASFDKEGLMLATEVFRVIAKIVKDTENFKPEKIAQINPHDLLVLPGKLALLNKKYHGMSKDLRNGLGGLACVIAGLGIIVLTWGVLIGFAANGPLGAAAAAGVGVGLCLLAGSIAARLNLREDIDANPVGKKIFEVIDKVKAFVNPEESKKQASKVKDQKSRFSFARGGSHKYQQLDSSSEEEHSRGISSPSRGSSNSNSQGS